MSRYFDTLKKMSDTSVPAAVEDEDLSSRVRGESRESDSSRAKEPPLSLGEREDQTVAVLLDTLRALAERRSRTFVVADVGGRTAARGVVEALDESARRRALSVSIVDLSRASGVDSVRRGLEIKDLATRGTDATLSDVVKAWNRRLGPDTDLALIIGPSLATGVDAALLARAAGGLVLVAESGVTRREALEAAVERAREVECHLAGIIMTGRASWLPEWLRTLVPSHASG